jgi:tRNA 2-selenouridine synthase
MKEKGLPIIDLEALAYHRGSVFGHVGISKKQTQKNFEASLYNEIKQYKTSPIVFVEGESQRIVSVVLSQSWMQHMKKGRKILVQSTLEKRTQRILNEYFPDYTDQMEEALNKLKKRLGGELFKEIYAYFKNKNYVCMIQLLL